MMEYPSWADGIRAINITYCHLLNMGVPKERLDEVRETLIKKFMDAGMQQAIQDGISARDELSSRQRV